MALQSQCLFHVSVFLVQLVAMATASEFYCHGTCYKGTFQPHRHVRKDHALLGHSYRNISDKTDQECFGTCINDCRCVSFQTERSRCELLQEDRMTAGEDFRALPGYSYYDVNQEFVQQDTENCLNGCCRSNPCLNGGTCTELCSDVKLKFTCACPLNYKGRVCEILSPLSSCPGINTTDPQAASQKYIIKDGSGNVFTTYCDLRSEPEFVWTLIESFSLAHKSDFTGKHFGIDFPINEQSLDWIDFRLAKTAIEYIYNQSSTHFRATCNFEKDNFDINATDYLRGKVSTLDIFPGSTIRRTCIEYERVRLMGTGCDNCTAETFNGGIYHPHLEDDTCDLNAALGYQGSYREYFGHYRSMNTQHQCSTSPDATTQWWLGVKL